MGDYEPADGDDEDGRLLVIAARDPEAFGALYDRNYTRVLAYFYRRTYCPHAAADLTAETFAQAWQQRCRYDSERGTGRAWIFGRLEEHTSELQSLMRISYAVFCLKKKKHTHILTILHVI